MITLILRALTAQGLSGEPFYTETVTIPDTPDALANVKREFAIKYGVEIGGITVMVKEGM